MDLTKQWRGALLLAAICASSLHAELKKNPRPGVLWEEEFGQVKLASSAYEGWRVTDDQGKPCVSLTAADGLGVFATVPGGKSKRACRYIPFQLDRKSGDAFEHLQVRVAAGRGTNWLLSDGSIGGLVTPAVDASLKGLFTVSYFAGLDFERKGQRVAGRTAMNVYLSGEGTVSFDFMRMAKRPMEGVYVTLRKAPDAPPAEAEIIRPGDRLFIEMPNPEALDANELSLWRADKGRLVPLAQANLPPRLYDDGTHGDKVAGDWVYSCEFVISPTDAAVKTGVNTIVVDAHTWGQDHNHRGHYYGFCPYAADLPAGSAEALSSALRLYDFGPPTGAVFPGAIAIRPQSSYEPESGAGWTKRPYYRGVAAKMPDALAQDCCLVTPGRKAVFRVDVPPGRWHVGVMVGHMGLMRGHALPVDSCRLLANDTVIHERDLSPAEHLRQRMALLDRDYRADEADVYDLFVAPVLPMHTASVEAPEGRIEVTIEASGAMKVTPYGLAVYPADGSAAEREARACLARIERQRRDAFHSFWSPSAPSEEDMMDELTVADAELPGPVREKGYAVFTRRDPFEYVYIYSRPRETELGRPVRLFACPGQVEPASVGLYPLRDLKDVRVEVTDLAAGEARIGRERIDLFYVVQYHYAVARNRRWWIAPNHFVPVGRRDFEPGVCRNYWLRVRVPEDAAPGVYEGRLSVSAANAPATTLPVAVRVLPTRLPELDDHLVAFINHMDFRGDAYLDREMAFMREVGCNAAELHFSWASTSKFEIKDGRVVGGKIDGRTDDVIERFLERCRKVGMPSDRPIMGLMALNANYQFRFGELKPSDAAYESAVHWCYGRLAEMARAKGFKGIVAYLGGEMGSGARDPSPENLAQSAKVVEMINAVPHVTTLYDCNCGGTARKISPLLGIAGMRQQQAWSFADEQYRRGRDKWLITYSVGGRFWNGLDSWRHGARGNFREYLTYPVMWPYNDFAGPCLTGHIHAMEGPEGPVPTVRSEMWRASVDDRRYLRLLEREMARQGADAPATREAASFLTALRRELDAHAPWTFHAYWSHGDDEPRDVDQNLIRWLAALYALKLQGRDAAPARLPVVQPLSPPQARGEAAPEPFAAEPAPPEAATDYDDGTWVSVTVGRGWEAQGILYDGVAWYRTEFEAPKDWASPWLSFEAVDETAWVYLNGAYVGTHEGWDEPFALAARDCVRPGRKNVLAVRVLDTKFQGGIWKQVWLCRDEPGPDKQVERRRLTRSWRLALRPGTGGGSRTFRLKFGRYYRHGEQAAIASFVLFPTSDAEAKALLSQGALIRLLDAQGALVASQPAAGIRIYRPVEAKVSLAGLAAGRYVARLEGGAAAMDYDFYVVPGP